MSKARKIESHLAAGGHLTGLQALRMFGVYRLSSVINRLRNKGWNIKTSMITKGYGVNKVSYASYSLER